MSRSTPSVCLRGFSGRAAFIAALFLALSLPLAAPAQDTGSEQATETPAARTLPPAYENEMMTLSEVLGALHYLRNLCGAKEGAVWRTRMQELLALEEPTEDRKARMIARFNRGYRGYREIYRDCTPSASEAANRYLRQGIQLSAQIPSRFGN